MSAVERSPTRSVERHPASSALLQLREALIAAVEAATRRQVAIGLSTRIRMLVDVDGLDVVVLDGRVAVEDISGEPDIGIQADHETWMSILAPIPRPTFQSFTALQLKNVAVEVTGNPLRIAQARQALEMIFEALRPAAPTAVSSIHRNHAIISGRYASLDVDGHATQVYYEEAGSGVPVVFLHTAGADSRQYHAFLSDVGLAERWQMIAFDMPAHGRSMPEDLGRYVPYRLTQRKYAGIVAAFLTQIVKRRAVLVGCSMGAAIALVLAADRPDLLRAAIALEPPLKSPGRRNPYLMHPEVATGAHNAAYVSGLMSPTTPGPAKRTAEWIYAQGGPFVYSGDLAFYSDEFDGYEIGPRIETSRVPIHLMTGEYDYSATPEDGERLSSLIVGSTFERMEALGHFPMVEDPDRVRSLLVRAVDSCLNRN